MLPKGQTFERGCILLAKAFVGQRLILVPQQGSSLSTIGSNQWLDFLSYGFFRHRNHLLV